MTRVFLDDSRIRGDTGVISGPDAHHLVNVLRMSVGDSFTVVDARAVEYSAEIVELAPERVLVRLGSPRPGATEPSLELAIYHGLPRLPRYETALRMCTELGVVRFVPVLTSRCVVRLQPGDGPGKAERWRRVVRAAARQSGRARVPDVVEPMGFDEALEQLRRSGVPAAMPAAGLAGSAALSLGDWVGALCKACSPAALAVLIGPESGFDLEEERAAAEAGATLVTMGPRILRTETAAVVAAAICLERAGQLS